MAIVAIAQQIGSRGIELGQFLAAELGYRFLSGNDLIAATARQYNVTAEQLRVVDERQPHFWERLRTDGPRLSAYFRAVALKEMAADRIVAVGRTAPIYLPDGFGCGLKVRAVAPLEARVRQVSVEEKLDRAAAEQRVREYDRELRERVRTLYGIEIDDPTRYHFMINTATYPLPALAAMLAACVRQTESACGEESLAMVRDAALVAQVRAAMLIHPRIGNAQIEVQCTHGAVTLSGASLVPPWDQLARQVVASVEGVVSIEVGAEEPPIPART